MDYEEHKARHKLLHQEFDELLGDFLEQTDATPSKTTIIELMKWSHQQTLNPSEGKK